MSLESINSNDEQRPVLDFLVPFDGAQPEVSEAERQEVSERFKALIDDTLLNHAGEVRHFDFGSEDTLLLKAGSHEFSEGGGVDLIS